ncbi:right-handed parallel beta-helix repeat-containing protein [Candidatus Dependentiae bacterium]|nr:right-handed parallel beta-helix repeat-containing protein [Candidatus Dependentiae bacterium]
MSTNNLATLRRLFFYAFVVPFTLNLPASALRAELLARGQEVFSQADDLSSLSADAQQIQGQLEEFLAAQPASEDAQELQSLHAQIKQLAQSQRQLSAQEVQTLNVAIDSAISYMSTLPEDAVRSRNCSPAVIIRGLKVLNCRLINIGNTLRDINNNVNSLTSTVNNFINADTCDAITPIRSVPFTITESGKYCLAQDVTYTGSDAAITIAASNVNLNLANHNIILPEGSTATAIAMDGVNEVTIENDSLRAANPTSIEETETTGIRIANSTDITVKNVNIDNLNTGIFITNSRGLRVLRSYFHNITFRAVDAFSSDDIAIEDSKFVNDLAFTDAGTAGVRFNSTSGKLDTPSCRNIRISDCQFSGTSLGGPIQLRFVDGALVENTTVSVDNEIFNANLLQGGSPNTGATGTDLDNALTANSIIIRNSSFKSQNVANGTDGIVLAAGSGALIENVVVDVNSPQDPTGNPPYLNGALHISASDQPCLTVSGVDVPVCGNPNAVYSNVRVSNSSFRNQGFYGVIISSGTRNVVIEECIISRNNRGIRIVGSTFVTLKNSSIEDNTTNGVLLSASLPSLPISDNPNQTFLSSSNNTIVDNRVSGNGGEGIFVTGVLFPAGSTEQQPQGTSATANANVIEHNIVTSNKLNGIRLGANTSNNSVRENLVIGHLFSAAAVGILNQGPASGAFAGNEFTYNEAHSNITNYSAGIAAIVVQGDPALAGQNINLGA